jgi:hypothetical protein
MDESTRPWFEELTVTPLITHAVEVLRAAIPRRGDIEPGGEGIKVKREFGIMSAESSRVVDEAGGIQEYDDLTLTDEQKHAAELLLATFEYHLFLIEQAYERPTSEEAKVYAHAAVYGEASPAGRLTAQDNFASDVERKLKISFDYSVEENVTVLT